MLGVRRNTVSIEATAPCSWPCRVPRTRPAFAGSRGSAARARRSALALGYPRLHLTAPGVARHVGQLLAHLRPSRFKVVVLDRLGVVGGYLGRLHLLARPHGRRGGEQGLRHALREIGPVLQRKLEHSHMRELLEAEQRDEVELLGFLEQLFSRLAQRADELALADHGLERLAQEIDRGIA